MRAALPALALLVCPACPERGAPPPPVLKRVESPAVAVKIPPPRDCPIAGAAETLVEQPGSAGSFAADWELDEGGFAVAWQAGTDVVFAWTEAGVVRSARAASGLRSDRMQGWAGGWAALPSVARHASGAAAAWFDGERIRLAHLRAGRVQPGGTVEVYGRAVLRRHGGGLGLVWSSGPPMVVLTQRIDPMALRPAGGAVTLDGVTAFAAARGGATIELLAMRKAECPGEECIRPVLVPFDGAALGAPEPIGTPIGTPWNEPAIVPPVRSGTRLAALVPGESGTRIAVRENGRTRVLPAPTGLLGGARLAAIAASDRGVAIGGPPQRLGGRVGAVVLQPWKGLPACVHRVAEAEGNLVDLALAPRGVHVDVYWLAESPASGEAKVALRRARIAWP